jgi:hypothetical protein
MVKVLIYTPHLAKDSAYSSKNLKVNSDYMLIIKLRRIKKCKKESILYYC